MYRLYIVLWFFSRSLQPTRYPYKRVQGRLDLGNIEVYRGGTPLLPWHISLADKDHLLR